MANYFSADKYSFTVANIIDYTPSNSYDVATIFNTLHYVNPMEQIKKVCSYVNTILVEMSADMENVLSATSFHNGTLQSQISPTEAKKMFTDLGFTITDLTGIDDELIGKRARFVAVKAS